MTFCLHLYVVVFLDGASREKLIYDKVLKSVAVCLIRKGTGKIFDLSKPLYLSQFFLFHFVNWN